MTTIGQALREGRQRLRHLATPTVDAQLLLAAILDVPRTYLLAHDERELTPEEAARFEKWLSRRARGEPIAYLLGRKAFYDREFIVTPDVLIPRPETELLLEAALDFARERPALKAFDIGTGSGALAVTLAANVPQASVTATDISPAALDVARRNAEAHGVRVTFWEGDLAQPLIDAGAKGDLIMANPPYIPHAEMLTLAVSAHEPHLALDGGPDGLDLIRRLLAQVPQVGKPGALILIEIGAGQGEAVLKLAAALQPTESAILRDYAGHDRILMLRR